MQIKIPGDIGLIQQACFAFDGYIQLHLSLRGVEIRTALANMSTSAIVRLHLQINHHYY
jgi:hypothetical protein